MSDRTPRAALKQRHRFPAPSGFALREASRFPGFYPASRVGVFRQVVRRLAGEEAAGITVVAAALVPVILLFALVLHDVTLLYAARAQAQTGADAAAKAAGLELTPLFGVGSDPAGAAGDYARRNGCQLLSCETGGSGSYIWVTVRVSRRTERLFLKPEGAVLNATARCYLDLSRGGLLQGSDDVPRPESPE